MRLRIRISSVNTDGTTTSEIKELKKDSCTIGRAGSDLMVPDGGASRRHAMFYQGLRGELRVMDLHSTNGTYLGEDKIIDHPIGSGTIVRVANTAVTVLDYEPDRHSVGANLNRANFEHAIDQTTQINVFRDTLREPSTQESSQGGNVSRRITAQPHPHKKIG